MVRFSQLGSYGRAVPDRIASRPQRALTAPIRSSPKWNRLAASTASAPARDRGGEVADLPGAAAGDDRYVDHRAHGLDQRQVETRLGAVGVHRVEQDLPGSKLGGPGRPRDGVEPGAAPAAVRGDLEGAWPRRQSAWRRPR